MTDVQGGSSACNLIFHFESLKAFLENASLKGPTSLLANPVRTLITRWLLGYWWSRLPLHVHGINVFTESHLEGNSLLKQLFWRMISYLLTVQVLSQFAELEHFNFGTTAQIIAVLVRVFLGILLRNSLNLLVGKCVAFFLH